MVGEGVTTRHHVRPDGSVGRCDAKEGGRCKFAREGALPFESAGEAQEYAADRAVRHENMIPDARRYVVTHPDLWDEALSDPEFYGWSDEDVRDVFEVSRELGLSDVEKRQRVNGRFYDRDKWEFGPPPVKMEPIMYRAPLGGDYRLSGFMRPEAPRGVARTRGLPDSELIRAAAERVMGGGAGE